MAARDPHYDTCAEFGAATLEFQRTPGCKRITYGHDRPEPSTSGGASECRQPKPGEGQTAEPSRCFFPTPARMPSGTAWLQGGDVLNSPPTVGIETSAPAARTLRRRCNSASATVARHVAAAGHVRPRTLVVRRARLVLGTHGRWYSRVDGRLGIDGTLGLQLATFAWKAA